MMIINPTCLAWVPSTGGSRFCGKPATKRMLTHYAGNLPVCDVHYEEARGRP